MIWNYKSKLTIYLDITNMEKIKIQVLFYIQKNLDEIRSSTYGEFDYGDAVYLFIFPLLKINIFANI